MRFLLALTLFFALAAHAQDSADFASSAAPAKSWNATHDMISDDQPNHAKVKAFVNDLLGKDRAPKAAIPEENSEVKPETEQ